MVATNPNRQLDIHLQFTVCFALTYLSWFSYGTPVRKRDCPLLLPSLFVGTSCLNIKQLACRGMISLHFVVLRKVETTAVALKWLAPSSVAAWLRGSGLNPLLHVCEPRPRGRHGHGSLSTRLPVRSSGDSPEMWKSSFPATPSSTPPERELSAYVSVTVERSLAVPPHPPTPLLLMDFSEKGAD